MTLSSFTSHPEKDRSKNRYAAAERFGQQVVSSLQKQSAKEYAALYPTSDAMLKLMDQNAAVYGQNLVEAKRDFQEAYQTKVLPNLNKSFYEIIEQGKTKGFDWSGVKLSEVKLGEASAKGTPVELVLKSNGTTFSIRYERTLAIEGQLKVSPFVRIDM